MDMNQEVVNAMGNVFAFMMVNADMVKEMDENVFGTCLCALIEEYCAYNKIDVTEYVDHLSKTVHGVNDEFGKKYTNVFMK